MCGGGHSANDQAGRAARSALGRRLTLEEPCEFRGIGPPLTVLDSQQDRSSNTVGDLLRRTGPARHRPVVVDVLACVVDEEGNVAGIA